MAETPQGAGLSWLASPLPLLGLLLMALNDHWLRAEWPGPLTWKLSDVAVLLYFPALLCALWSLFPRPWRPRPSSRAGVLLSCALSGGALAAINLSPAASELYVGTLEFALAGSFAYTPDPSDCWALIVLPVVAWDGLRRLGGSE
ncbi:MAG: hypothetical protein JKY65_17585 [Planctomycetes bacterium]|nr:hypothetical protein [Planctomycetota bacterium]